MDVTCRGLPEVLALVHLRDMYFDGGYRDCLERVEQGYRGMGVGSGVQDNAIKATIGVLDGIDEITLMIGLEAHAVHKARLFGSPFAELEQLREARLAIDVRLTDAEQVDVGPVDDKEPGTRGFLRNYGLLSRQGQRCTF